MRVYVSIFYYQSCFGDRINCGIIMFSRKRCIVKSNDDRLKFIKNFNSKGAKLFIMGVKNMAYHFNNVCIPTVKGLTDLHYKSNNIFGIEKPKRIMIDFTQENFNKFFDKVF